MAFLPLALTALSMAAEPKGGWEQYHTKGEKRKGKKISRSLSTTLAGDDRRPPRRTSMDPESNRRHQQSSQFFDHKNEDISSRRAHTQEPQPMKTPRRAQSRSPTRIYVHRSSFDEERRRHDVPEEFRRNESVRSSTMAARRTSMQQHEKDIQYESKRLRISREYHSSPEID